MRSLSSFFILCLVATINGEIYMGIFTHNRTFSLLKTGPFVVNSEIDFLVKVAYAYGSRATSYEYRFKFDQFPQYDKTIVWPVSMKIYSVRFASTCELKSGNYTVQVEVLRSVLGAPMQSLGTLLDTFELKECQWTSQINNDGPAILGTPITFIASNNFQSYNGPPLEYRFKFDEFPGHDKTIVSTEVGVEYTITFESSLTVKPGNYTVQLNVWTCHLGVPSYSLGAVNSTFQLTDSLTGFIYSKNSEEHCVDNNIQYVVSTEMPAELTVEIRDPTGYFMGRCGTQPFNITYMYNWTVNGKVQEDNFNDKFIERTFTKPQPNNNISVIVTAKTNGSCLMQTSGSFKIKLRSQDQITNFTVDGPTKVNVFERLQLDCKVHEGTPPFHYRYSFSMDGESESFEKNTNETNFEIIHYFSEKGTRNFLIFIENGISKHTEEMKISVH